MGGGWTDLGVRADPDNPHALREHLATAVALGYATVATDMRVDAGDKAAGREIARGLDPIDPAALASALAPKRWALTPCKVAKITMRMPTQAAAPQIWWMAKPRGDFAAKPHIF